MSKPEYDIMDENTHDRKKYDYNSATYYSSAERRKMEENLRSTIKSFRVGDQNADCRGIEDPDKILRLREGNLRYIERADKDKKINRFRNNEGVDFFSSGIGYVFMTKPHLNIANNKGTIGDPFIYSITKGSSNIAKMIRNNLDHHKGNDNNYDYGKGVATKDPFINIITNAVEKFDTKDLILKTKEIGETFYGEKLHWGDTYFESIGGDVITLDFTEYSDMSLTLLHKTWVDYIHAVKLNKIQPYRSDETGSWDYVADKIVDYASSIYYFLLDVDGTTIKYYAKYTGVFPTSVPFSAMSFNLGQNEAKKLSIQYQYSFKEDMDPRILDEFSYLTNPGRLPYSKNDDEPINLNNNWVNRVTITRDRKNLIFY